MTTKPKVRMYQFTPGLLLVSCTQLAAFLVSLGFPYDGGEIHREDGRYWFRFIPPPHAQEVVLAWFAPASVGLHLDPAKIKLMFAVHKNLKGVAKLETNGEPLRQSDAMREFFIERATVTERGKASLASLMPEKAGVSK